MSAASRVAWVVVGVTTMTVVACGLWPEFPDEGLHPPRMDGGTDTGVRLDTGMAMDTGRSDTGPMDTGVIRDIVAEDTTPPIVDALDVPEDANPCDFLPSFEVPVRRVSDGLAGARDIAFNGAGQFALAGGTATTGSLVLVGMSGMRTTVIPSGLGDVASLRFGPMGELLLAGVTDGAVRVVAPGSAEAQVRVAGLTRPSGLAVDRDGAFWYADQAGGTVVRVPFDEMDGGGARISVPITGPRHLALDDAGAFLYVGTSTGTVLRIPLVRGDGGGVVGVGPFQAYAASFLGISGLALDRCGNLYVAEEDADRIRRVPPMSSDPDATVVYYTLITDVRRPRGLAFGQGGFDRRVLFTISGADDTNGAVYAAGVGAEGVALPVPGGM